MRQQLTRERLLEALSYDRASGIFTWKVRPSKKSRRRIGDIAGGIERVGNREYWCITIDEQEHYAHRLAWYWVTGEWPSQRVSFRDGDGLNCRFENLVLMATSDTRVIDWDDKAQKNAYTRAHRIQNPDHYANKYLLRDFGISLSEYNKLLALQKGVCAICHHAERVSRGGKLKRLAVDHDHSTGKIRALLCQHCNQAIGKMRDDPALLRAAAEYLECHRHPEAEVIPFRAKETA